MLEGPWIFYSEPEKIDAHFDFENFSKGVEEALQKIGEIPLQKRMGELLLKVFAVIEETEFGFGYYYFNLKKQLDSIKKMLTEASKQKNEINVISYISNTIYCVHH